VGGLPAHKKISGALGWTHVSDGTILPFTNVDCDGIRDFLGINLLSVRSNDRLQAYGRALGRVLAHELYHIFANTQHHGSDGVGKSAYTVQELLSPEFRFKEQDLEALRNSKAHSVLQTPGAVDASK
jgi:hypothetical protein